MGRLCSGKLAAGDDISGSTYTGTSVSIVPLTRTTHPEGAGRAGRDGVGRGGDGSAGWDPTWRMEQGGTGFRSRDEERRRLLYEY